MYSDKLTSPGPDPLPGTEGGGGGVLGLREELQSRGGDQGGHRLSGAMLPPLDTTEQDNKVGSELELLTIHQFSESRRRPLQVPSPG